MTQKPLPVYKTTFRNLSTKVSESKFIQLILKFGDVEDVKFRKDRAYAYFRSKRAAEKAALEMDGKKYDGQTLSVSVEDRREIMSSSYGGGGLSSSENKKDTRGRSRSHSIQREGVKRIMKRRPTPRRSFSRSTSRG